MSKPEAKAQLVGHRYHVGMHIVACHGPVDELVQIKVEDKLAYSAKSERGSKATPGGNVPGGTQAPPDDVKQSKSIYIHEPELFGGEEKEGGVVGQVDVMFGDDDQGVNSYLVSQLAPGSKTTSNATTDKGYYVDSSGLVRSLTGQVIDGYKVTKSGSADTAGAKIPAFRGVFSVVLRQVYVAAMSAYIKPWYFRIRRYPKVPLPSGLDRIGFDANPAAVILECLINRKWGLGLNFNNDLILDSFEAAARTLKSEGFGISVTWSDQTKMEDFLATILKVIDGYRYSDPVSGKIGIKLARKDYDVANLFELNESNIVSFNDFGRPDPSEIINQVTVTFLERGTDQKKRSTPAHNNASIDALGYVNPTTLDFPAISKLSLANKVALRELNVRSRGLASLGVVANRKAAHLKCGDVVKVSWVQYGLDQIVCRVTEIDYGLLTDGRVTIKLIEDQFSLPDVELTGDVGTSWEDPIQNVKPLTNTKVTEAPYYFVAKYGDPAALPDGGGFLLAMAQKAQSISTGYRLWELTQGNYADRGRAGFAPGALLTEAADDTQRLVKADWFSLDNLVPGVFGFLGDELVQVVGIDVDADTVTLERGLFDTPPVAHAAGETLWLADATGAAAFLRTAYLAGQTATVRMQPLTSVQALPVTECPELKLTFTGRADRPYAPGNVRVNGVYRPKHIEGLVTSVQWSHRNRLSQVNPTPVLQTAGDLTPEAGTTYTVRFLQRRTPEAAWSLTEELTGIPGNSAAPTKDLLDAFLRVEVYAVRDGLTSYKPQALEIERSGYGIGYGYSYGGMNNG